MAAGERHYPLPLLVTGVGYTLTELKRVTGVGYTLTELKRVVPDGTSYLANHYLP